MSIAVPISFGEFIDKITILELKSERIRDPVKLQNAEHELRVLRAVWQDSDHSNASIEEDRARLKAVNAQLWDIEDHIRVKERRSEFDAEFVALARSVYRLNDERAQIKRALNVALGSDLVEEKFYTDFDASIAP